MLENLYILFKGIYYPYSLTLQETAGFYAYGVTRFYSLLLNILVFIAILILCLLLFVYIIYGPNHFFRKNYYDLGSTFIKQDILEWLWSLLPLFILIGLIYPSFALLYSVERFPENFDYSVVVTGHQWFWTYELTYINENLDIISTSWEAKIVGSGLNYKTASFENSFIYLLETNKALFLPAQKYIQLLITSSDVIHSWALPALGLKLDAVPGRLNQLIAIFKKPGIFFGQCSELCGVGHSLMPIVVIVTSC